MKTEKVGIPIYNNRVSPLFDTAEKFVVTELKNRTPDIHFYTDIDMNIGFNEFEKLIDIGINIIICSAISKKYANYLISNNIELIPGVIGLIDDVIKAYCENRLIIDEFAMPGYRWGKSGKGRRRGQKRRQCLRYREMINIKEE